MSMEPHMEDDLEKRAQAAFANMKTFTIIAVIVAIVSTIALFVA